MYSLKAGLSLRDPAGVENLGVSKLSEVEIVCDPKPDILSCGAVVDGPELGFLGLEVEVVESSRVVGPNNEDTPNTLKLKIKSSKNEGC